MLKIKNAKKVLDKLIVLLYYLDSTVVQFIKKVFNFHKGGVSLGWSFDNSKPIYIQIADRIEAEILSGNFYLGEKIPSVRELALQASVNPNTMQRALTELETRGLVTVQRTAGRLVTNDISVIEKVKYDKAEQTAKDFIAQFKALKIDKEKAEQIINELW